MLNYIFKNFNKQKFNFDNKVKYNLKYIRINKMNEIRNSKTLMDGRTWPGLNINVD